MCRRALRRLRIRQTNVVKWQGTQIMQTRIAAGNGKRSIGPRLDAPTPHISSSGKVHNKEVATVFLKITAKRQVTLPARVLDALGVKPGDRIELGERPEGFVLRTRHVDRTRLAPLRGKLRSRKGRFDLEGFRNKPHDRTLRD